MIRNFGSRQICSFGNYLIQCFDFHAVSHVIHAGFKSYPILKCLISDKFIKWNGNLGSVRFTFTCNLLTILIIKIVKLDEICRRM